MDLKVRKIGNGYGVLLPKQLLEELGVQEGDTLHMNQREKSVYEIRPHDAAFARAMKAFREIEPKHRNTLRELAK